MDLAGDRMGILVVLHHTRHRPLAIDLKKIVMAQELFEHVGGCAFTKSYRYSIATDAEVLSTGSGTGDPNNFDWYWYQYWSLFLIDRAEVSKIIICHVQRSKLTLCYF